MARPRCGILTMLKPIQDSSTRSYAKFLCKINIYLHIRKSSDLVLVSIFMKNTGFASRKWTYAKERGYGSGKQSFRSFFVCI